MKAALAWWNEPIPYNGWGVIGIAAMGSGIAHAYMGQYGRAAIFAVLWLAMLIVNSKTRSS